MLLSTANGENRRRDEKGALAAQLRCRETPSTVGADATSTRLASRTFRYQLRATPTGTIPLSLLLARRKRAPIFAGSPPLRSAARRLLISKSFSRYPSRLSPGRVRDHAPAVRPRGSLGCCRGESPGSEQRRRRRWDLKSESGRVVGASRIAALRRQLRAPWAAPAAARARLLIPGRSVLKSGQFFGVVPGGAAAGVGQQ